MALGHADYAKGNRFKATGGDKIPAVRLFGNLVLSALTKIVSGYWHVSDTQCGYTAINRVALAAVESSNGSNRQFIQTAEAGIRSLLGAQAGGGSFANVGGTTGTVLRTAVAVLNSFNNPLRGIFS